MHNFLGHFCLTDLSTQGFEQGTSATTMIKFLTNVYVITTSWCPKPLWLSNELDRNFQDNSRQDMKIFDLARIWTHQSLSLLHVLSVIFKIINSYLYHRIGNPTFTSVSILGGPSRRRSLRMQVPGKKIWTVCDTQDFLRRYDHKYLYMSFFKQCLLKKYI